MGFGNLLWDVGQGDRSPLRRQAQLSRVTLQQHVPKTQQKKTRVKTKNIKWM